MKIGRTSPSNHAKFSAITKVEPELSFSQTFKKSLTSFPSNTEERLLKIDHQARILEKNMTILELQRYKKMIQDFLTEIVLPQMKLKHEKGWDRRGRIKQHQLLDKLDVHLEEMVHDLLTKQHSQINILNKIGEIKGILVDLAF